eukprot:jgi/Ulvmu1/8653/UM046_0058.1
MQQIVAAYQRTSHAPLPPAPGTNHGTSPTDAPAPICRAPARRHATPPDPPKRPASPSQRAVLPDVSRTALALAHGLTPTMRDLTEADLFSDTQVDPKPASDAPPSLEAPYPDRTGERTGEAMRRFVNLLLSGTIPHSDLLLASRLIAIAKPNGGVRPIAIGEAFMRLAGICALAASGVKQGDPIGPLYFAIAFRPTLLAAQEAAPDTLAIACHDDLTVQGTVEQVVAMGRVVQSRHQCNKQKTLVHCTDPAKASHAAACLGATVATDGMVACGAPLAPLPMWRRIHGGMGLRHYTADVADAARLASAAVAHAVLADGIDGGKPFRGDAAVQHQARLARLRKAWPAVQGISDSPTPADAWASDAGLEAAHDAAPDCSGSLASAFLTACPGPVTGLTDHEFQVAVLLRLGEPLLPVLESDEACPCGRVAASGTHSVICGQLWASSVLKHDLITVAWRRVLMRASIASSLEPHVGKLPGGIRVLPLRGSRQSPPAAPPADFTRPPAAPSASAPAAPCQQDPPPPPPPPQSPPPPPPPTGPPSRCRAGPAPTPSLAGPPGFGRAPTPLMQPPQRGDLLAFLTTRMALLDVKVMHPLARSHVRGASREAGATAEKGARQKRDKYGAITGAAQFIPLVHETYGRVGRDAYRFLQTVAEVAAGHGAVSKRTFLLNAMRDLSTTLCRALARQARAAAPLRARLVGRALLPGLPVPTDGLPALTGHRA